MEFCCCADAVVPYAGKAAVSVFCLSEEQEQGLHLLLSCLLSLNLAGTGYLHILSSLIWLILMDSQHAGEDKLVQTGTVHILGSSLLQNPESRNVMARDENSSEEKN